MSRKNGTRYIKFHETIKRKCRLDASVRNNKQRWNENECRCECKELINKGFCNIGFIWNPSKYDNLDYCICRKKLIDKLIGKCTENVDEEETYPEKLHSEETITPVCNSCTVYIIIFPLIFALNIGVATYFVYYKYLSDNKKTVAKEGSIVQTKIYWIKFLEHIKDDRTYKYQTQKLLSLWWHDRFKRFWLKKIWK